MPRGAELTTGRRAVAREPTAMAVQPLSRPTHRVAVGTQLTPRPVADRRRVAQREDDQLRRVGRRCTAGPSHSRRVDRVRVQPLAAPPREQRRDGPQQVLLQQQRAQLRPRQRHRRAANHVARSPRAAVSDARLAQAPQHRLAVPLVARHSTHELDQELLAMQSHLLHQQVSLRSSGRHGDHHGPPPRASNVSLHAATAAATPAARRSTRLTCAC
mmetsp:Transcript_19647/g.69561  ORF Transcript_19647/g.69561 Transcript_19647/m.69561 type:complete len:215 (+) Transcript_19647:264-908(+)